METIERGENDHVASHANLCDGVIGDGEVMTFFECGNSRS
jgi:hypothetical protein